MANPKLAMIPTGYKAGKVYSVLPESGVGDFTFDRDSKATRVNENGLIEIMDNDVPRLDYTDGGCPSLLLEPESTNLITYSEDFSDSYWTKSGSSITSNAVISPDGTLNASKLKEDTGNSNHNIYSNNITVTLGSEYTVSLYVKKAERSIIRIDGGYRLTLGATFNLNTLQVTGVGTIEALANDWYKLTASGVGEISNGETNIFAFLLDNSGTQSYQGDGTSGVYIWGAQLEQQEYATSYIPTNGTTITRVGETCTDSGDASTFNDSEGVLMAEISALYEDDSNRYVSISDGSLNNRLVIRYIGNNQIGILGVVGGSIQVNLTPYVNDITINSKVVLKYKQNDFAMWIDGFKIGTDTSGSLPSAGTFNRLNISGATGASSFFYGKVKQIQYFDSALTDAEIETLTSWASFTEMANGQNYTII